MVTDNSMFVQRDRMRKMTTQHVYSRQFCGGYIVVLGIYSVSMRNIRVSFERFDWDKKKARQK